MLNRSQILTMIAIRNREGSVFNPKGKAYKLPANIIEKISVIGFDPNSDAATLLHHIAYGDLVAAKTMLDANPRLALEAGHVETPSGLKVMHTTPLQCALGAGDPEMAEMIAPFFEQFAGGVKEREEQYIRYRSHIESMLNQPGYDFKPLLDLIIQSSPEDITAALQHTLNPESNLYKGFKKFRADFTPGKMTVGMLLIIRIYRMHISSLIKNGINCMKAIIMPRKHYSAGN